MFPFALVSFPVSVLPYLLFHSIFPLVSVVIFVSCFQGYLILFFFASSTFSCSVHWDISNVHSSSLIVPVNSYSFNIFLSLIKSKKLLLSLLNRAYWYLIKPWLILIVKMQIVTHLFLDNKYQVFYKWCI